MDTSKSRRDFFKQILGVAGAAVVAPAMLKAVWTSTALADTCKFVVPGQGMAASVNYTEDKKKAKKELQIERNGVPFAKQFCSGCALFTKDATGDFGKCALFGADCVKAKSWCGSWNKKA